MPQSFSQQAGFWSFLIFLFASPTQARVTQSFHEVITRVQPSVVHIRSLERPLRTTLSVDPYGYFFQTQPPQNSSSFPLGTGFLIEPGGYCITSFQIVDGMQRLEIITSNKKRYTAEYVGGDRQSDMALLRIKDGKGLPSLDFGQSDLVQVGDPVLGFGSPLGFKSLVATGIISAKGQVMGAGPFDNHLVVDLSTHPGNIGGPLVDARGRVIGLLSSPSNSLAAIGFALPSKTMQNLMQDLMKHGKLRKAWLGLVARNLVSMDAETELYDPNIRSGIIVDNLIVEGPAARAKLQVGDLILALGDQKIQSINDLQSFLRRSSPSEKISIKVFRRRAGHLSLSIQLGEIPGAQDLPQERDLY